jgi:hypothetical protein
VAKLVYPASTSTTCATPLEAYPKLGITLASLQFRSLRGGVLHNALSAGRQDSTPEKQSIQNQMICAAHKVTDTGHQSLVIGVLISYQDDRKGCAVIADKVSKP